MEESKKHISNIVYLDNIKFFSTLAVVLLHVCCTVNDNFSVSDVGIINYNILSCVHLFLRWAVPCFIMCSGALLLDPERIVTSVKLRKYILRMLAVLFLFGSVYALMELIFDSGVFKIEYLPLSIFNVLQNKSWSHMWYIYMLLGLYFLTPLCRIFVKYATPKQYRLVLLLLFITSCFIPSMNNLLNIKISNMYISLPYVFYYLAGYYLSSFLPVLSVRKELFLYILGVISTVLLCIIQINHSADFGKELLWIRDAPCIFNTFTSIALFYFLKHHGNNKIFFALNKKIILKYSFSIYLLHPFYINLMYKFIGFIPSKINIIAGITLLFFIVLFLSLASSVVLKKIPIINRIV